MASTPPDESRAGSVIATLAVSFGLVIITLALRLCARFQITKSPGWDDLTAILATVRRCFLIFLCYYLITRTFSEGMLMCCSAVP